MAPQRMLQVSRGDQNSLKHSKQKKHKLLQDWLRWRLGVWLAPECTAEVHYQSILKHLSMQSLHMEVMRCPINHGPHIDATWQHYHCRTKRMAVSNAATQRRRFLIPWMHMWRSQIKTKCVDTNHSLLGIVCGKPRAATCLSEPW